jgi:hypothetical protein
MNVMNEIAEARASALSLRASAKACTGEQGALKFRLTRAAESLDRMVLLAMRGIERVEQLTGEPSVETFLLQAQLLLHDADEANHSGDYGTFALQCQARELLGAALDLQGGAP